MSLLDELKNELKTNDKEEQVEGLEMFIPYTDSEIEPTTRFSVYTQAEKELLNIQAGLEALKAFVESTKAAGGLEQKSYQVVQQSIHNLVSGWIDSTLPGLESFESEKTAEELADIGLEGITDTLKKIKDKALTVGKKIKESVIVFFKSTEGNIRRYYDIATKLKHDIQSKEFKEGKISLSDKTIINLSIDDKVDPIKGLNDLNDLIQSLSKPNPILEEMKEASMFVLAMSKIKDEESINKKLIEVMNPTKFLNLAKSHVHLTEVSEPAKLQNYQTYKSIFSDPDWIWYQSSPFIGNTRLFYIQNVKELHGSKYLADSIFDLARDKTITVSNKELVSLTKSEALKLLDTIMNSCNNALKTKSIVTKAENDLETYLSSLSDLVIDNTYTHGSLADALYHRLADSIYINTDSFLYFYYNIIKQVIASIGASLNYINESIK